jgi:hypothetical protein
MAGVAVLRVFKNFNLLKYFEVRLKGLRTGTATCENDSFLQGGHCRLLLLSSLTPSPAGFSPVTEYTVRNRATTLTELFALSS